MLSYRHSFHAGNYADVLKHLTLMRILAYLGQKEKAIHYVDSHAGAGGYRLESREAQKTSEYQNGIGALYQRNDLPDILQEYVNCIKQFNGQKPKLKAYPGSPWIADYCLRRQDRLFLYELHPSDYELLAKQFAQDRRIQTHQEDGFKHAVGHFPPISRRGLLLIDPPYEQKVDYEKVVTLIKKVHLRFPSGCIALWYPVVDRNWIKSLERELKATNIPNIQLFELSQTPDSSGFGMNASGMIVINPPWTLKNELAAVLPYLSKILAVTDKASYRCEQLVSE